MSFVILTPSAEEACRMAFLLHPFLHPAIEESRGELQYVDVFELARKRLCKFWLVCEETSKDLVGVAVTEEIEYPQYSNLRVTLMGGRDMKAWQDTLDQALCEYCERNSLAHIEVVGRKGFSKVLAPLGYEPAYTVLLKSAKEVYCG